MQKVAGIGAVIGLLALGGCGGEPAESALHVGFRQHALVCQPPEAIQAELQISGVDALCPLTVNDDHTVSGVCPNVPTGVVRIFRLVYFVTIGTTKVQLAAVVQILDLTGETRRAITLELPADQLQSSFDDDGDGMTNLLEVCTGRDPLTPGA